MQVNILSSLTSESSIVTANSYIALYQGPWPFGNYPPHDPTHKETVVHAIVNGSLRTFFFSETHVISSASVGVNVTENEWLSEKDHRRCNNIQDFGTRDRAEVEPRVPTAADKMKYCHTGEGKYSKSGSCQHRWPAIIGSHHFSKKRYVMFDEGKLMLWESSIYETICIPAEVQIIADDASNTSNKLHNPNLALARQILHILHHLFLTILVYIHGLAVLTLPRSDLAERQYCISPCLCWMNESQIEFPCPFRLLLLT